MVSESARPVFGLEQVVAAAEFRLCGHPGAVAGDVLRVEVGGEMAASARRDRWSSLRSTAQVSSIASRLRPSPALYRPPYLRLGVCCETELDRRGGVSSYRPCDGRTGAPVLPKR